MIKMKWQQFLIENRKIRGLDPDSLEIRSESGSGRYQSGSEILYTVINSKAKQDVTLAAGAPPSPSAWTRRRGAGSPRQNTRKTRSDSYKLVFDGQSYL